MENPMIDRTDICRFVYCSNLASEDKMFADLDVAFRRFQIDGRLEYEIKLCISEAFSNALTHGNKLDPSKRVILTLHVNTIEVRADIEDEGQGAANKIQGRQSPEQMDESGRGVDLIERYASRVTLDESVSGGLLLRMWFTRNPNELSQRTSKKTISIKP